MNASTRNVYVVILNYNNWQDTIACAESVLKSSYENYKIIIVDNASVDNSMDSIRRWAKGELQAWVEQDSPHREKILGDAYKMLSHDYYDARAIHHQNEILSDQKIILIQSHDNRGYGAGNNIGIKYALSRGDYSYVWLLNNDTVVREDAMEKLVTYAKRDENLGILGSALLYYDHPDLIQTLGGKFNKYFAVPSHILANYGYKKALDESFDTKRIDYVVGASMMLTRTYLDKIGLMPEGYFIYFEEIDMATNAAKHGLQIDLCLESIVYHKESATIKKENLTRSEFSDYYAMRNRLIYTKKYREAYLPSVYVGLVLSSFVRLFRGEFGKIKNIFKIIFKEKLTQDSADD